MKGVIFVFLVLINEVHIVIPVGVAEQVSVRLEVITDVAFLPDIERFRALVFADEALTTEEFECRGSSYASKIFRTGICPFVKFCRANISPERLKGFLMAPWSGDYDEKSFMKTNLDGIDQLAAAL